MRYNKEGDYFECQYGRVTFRYMAYDKSKKRNVWE
jgi:hypothetical protein